MILKKLGASASCIKIGNGSVGFGCAFLMIQCTFFVMLVTAGIGVCHVMTLDSRGNRNGRHPPPLMKSPSLFVKKSTIFYSFGIKWRTKLLHIIHIHYLILHIAT